MIRALVPLALLLAACGVDGPPIPPSRVEPGDTRSTLVIGGTVGMGIASRP